MLNRRNRVLLPDKDGRIRGRVVRFERRMIPVRGAKGQITRKPAHSVDFATINDNRLKGKCEYA
jgi:hypothetical protein